MATKRATPGTGSVYEDKPNNRYVGQITLGGKRHKVYARTKTECRAKLNDVIKRGGTAPLTIESGRGLTVATLIEQWITRDLDGRDRAPSTVATHRWAKGHIALDPLGRRTASSVRVRDVDDMLDRLAANGLGRSSLRKVQNTLAQAMRFGVRRGDLDRNPALDATLPPTATRTAPRSSLTPDEARLLLTTIRDERNGLMFALMLRLGLRPGEAAGLFWSDLDDGVVNVTRAVQLDEHGNASIADELKTAASKRTLAIPTDLVDWIADHRRQQVAERLAAESWADDRLVFASVRGSVLNPANVRRHLDECCHSAGIRRTAPNELRHSCASLLSDSGVSNEQIADLLGHTTTRMVDSTYRHRLRPVVSIAATTEADWLTG